MAVHRRPSSSPQRARSAPLHSSAEDDEADTLNLDDERLYQVTLPASTGIEWGGDLQLRWVRVLGFEDGSAAPYEGVKKGDQLVCVDGESTVGESLGDAIALFREARLRRSGGDDSVELVLFRGTAEQLQDLVTGAAAKAGKDIGPLRQDQEAEVTVTVVDATTPKAAPRVLKCAPGTNLRNLLVEKGISPYRSMTRWTNCSGKQLCGTCIVDVQAGAGGCSRAFKRFL